LEFGVLKMECHDVDDEVDSFATLFGKNWLLSKIFGTSRDPFDALSTDEETALRRGKYTSPDGKIQIQFKVPVNLKRGRPMGAD